MPKGLLLPLWLWLLLGMTSEDAGGGVGGGAAVADAGRVGDPLTPPLLRDEPRAEKATAEEEDALRDRPPLPSLRDEPKERWLEAPLLELGDA